MVGLVSAFGGKDFSTFCLFLDKKKKQQFFYFFFKETFLSGVKI